MSRRSCSNSTNCTVQHVILCGPVVDKQTCDFSARERERDFSMETFHILTQTSSSATAKTIHAPGYGAISFSAWLTVRSVDITLLGFITVVREGCCMGHRDQGPIDQTGGRQAGPMATAHTLLSSGYFPLIYVWKYKEPDGLPRWAMPGPLKCLSSEEFKTNPLTAFGPPVHPLDP